jgi:hypothetical protein
MYENTYTENFILHKSSSTTHAEFYLQKKKSVYYKLLYTYKNVKFLLTAADRINLMLSFLDTMKVYGEMEVDPILISISTILG